MWLAMKFPDFTDASCAGIGIEPFFEDEENHGKFTNLKTVRVICASCPVNAACAEWGLHHEKYGIWGGLTPEERNRIRKVRNITLVDPKMLADLGYSKGIPR